MQVHDTILLQALDSELALARQIAQGESGINAHNIQTQPINGMKTDLHLQQDLHADSERLPRLIGEIRRQEVIDMLPTGGTQFGGDSVVLRLLHQFHIAMPTLGERRDLSTHPVGVIELHA